MPSPKPASVPSPRGTASTAQSLRARWFPGVKSFPCSSLRVAGMLPVLMVLAIHVLAYFTAVPGTLLPLASDFPIATALLLLIFHVLFALTLVNYGLLVFADPGSVPSDWRAQPPPPVQRASAAPLYPAAVASATPRHAPGNVAWHTAVLPITTDERRRDAADIANAGEDEDEGADARYMPSSASASALLAPSSTAAPSSPPTTHFRYARLMRERSSDGQLRYCHTCESYKPDRSHHCSVCRRCILRMDHHCVFVNNCISFYNHKFFVSFVSFAFVGCSMVALVSFPTFAEIIAVTPTPRSSAAGLSASGARVAALSPFSAAARLSVAMKTVVMIGYIMTSSFALALAGFVGLHLFLVARGRTTIEMYEMTDADRAARIIQYDLGCARNFRKVFGHVPLCWFLPTRAYLDGDGTWFEMRDDDCCVGDDAA